MRGGFATVASRTYYGLTRIAGQTKEPERKLDLMKIAGEVLQKWHDKAGWMWNPTFTPWVLIFCSKDRKIQHDATTVAETLHFELAIVVVGARVGDDVDYHARDAADLSEGSQDVQGMFRRSSFV